MADRILSLTNETGVRRAYEDIPDRGDDWVVRGCKFQADFGTNTLRVTTGEIAIVHSGTLYWVRTQGDRSVSLDSGANDVYYTVDTSGSTPTGSITATTGSAPSEPRLKIGTADTNAQTTDDTLNRDPDLAAGSLSAEQLNNAKVASAFSGSDGYAQIQAAIDAAESEMSNPVAVVDGDGPDDVTGIANADQNRGTDAWLLSDSVTVSDRTTLIGINCYLFRADNLDKPGIVNEKLDDGTADRNSDIDIIGIGGAWLDGNEEGQTDAISDANRSGIHLHKVDNYEISGWKVSDCGFNVVPEDCTEGYSENIEIDSSSQGTGENGDGYHVVGPASDIEVNGLTGKFGDDACVANATDDGGSGPSQGFGDGGNVEGIEFNDVRVDDQDTASVLRVAGTSNAPYAARDISVNGAYFNGTTPVVRIGGGDDVTDGNLQRNISIDGLTLAGTPNTVVRLKGTSHCQQLTLTNISCHDNIQRLIQMEGNTLKQFNASATNLFVSGSSGQSVIEFGGGTMEDSRVEGLTVRGNDTMDLMEIDANATAKNVAVEATTVNLGQPIVKSGATVEKLRMDVSPRSGPAGYDINETDAYANGVEYHGTISDQGKQALAGGRTARTTITVINTTDGTVEEFTLLGGGNAVVQHGIDTTNFGVSEDNDGTINVYWDATNSQYELNNEEGAGKDIEVTYDPVPVA